MRFPDISTLGYAPFVGGTAVKDGFPKKVEKGALFPSHFPKNAAFLEGKNPPLSKNDLTGPEIYKCSFFGPQNVAVD